MNFGEELRRQRQQRGLSLRNCAGRMYLSPGYLSKVENGTKPPTDAVATAADQVFQTGGTFHALLAQADSIRAGLPTLHHATAGLASVPFTYGPMLSELEALAMAADRAQRFTLGLPGTADLTIEQITDGVHDLALAYPSRPLSELLGHIMSTQDTIFSLLERPQRPNHGRQLYFLASVACAMLSKASHDLGDPSAALTQSRTAFLCAEQTDHDGLRAWICGLQSLISYWAGRPHDSVRYAQRGTEYAGSHASTVGVWLPANEARAWARLGNVDETTDAIHRAEVAAAHVQPDELDELGGFATFTRARQLYYAADALAWLPTQSSAAQHYAAQAVEAYADPDAPDWAFGDQAGAAADLSLARLHAGELEGAAEALAPVLALPTDQRINGIIKSLQRVHHELNRGSLTEDGTALQEEIEAFTRTPACAPPR
jgi:transcriptional regulator with XRE-family HTH domain